MDSSILIANMYNMTKEMMGEKEAKDSVSVMISLIIHDLTEEGKDITPENLNERIESYVKDFWDVYEAKKSA